jgi:hypothetical protein
MKNIDTINNFFKNDILIKNTQINLINHLFNSRIINNFIVHSL